MISHLPAFYYLLTALIVPFLPLFLRRILYVVIPLFVLSLIFQLNEQSTYVVSFLGINLNLLRADSLAKTFAIIFTLSSFAAFLFGFYLKNAFEHAAGFLYVGAALGVIFAADLLSLYFFWEVMAVGSTLLVFLNKTQASLKAAYRYFLIHVVGGLLLLAGVMHYFMETGSLAFDGFDTMSLSSFLILIGFLVNAAAFPFSSWMPDAYPKSTLMGGVLMSAFTSKTAVYALLRGFSSWDILIILGCVMALYGVIYALIENDIRRLLSYSIIHQVGFMLCAVGVGSKLAIAGAAAHAFSHITYKGLLWMVAAAVIYRTGKHKFSDLCGLAKQMPITAFFAFIAAFSAMGLPFTSGFTTKSLIILSVEYAGLFWVFLILEVLSAAVFLNAGFKFSYLLFFNGKNNLRVKEAPISMLLPMGLLSLLCLLIGCFPNFLYNLLPYASKVIAKVPSTFSQLYLYSPAALITKMQLILFSALAFFLLLPKLKKKNTLTLDVDVTYRKGFPFLAWCLDKLLNGFNQLCDRLILKQFIPTLCRFAQAAPATFFIALFKPFFANNQELEQRFKSRVINNQLSVSVTALSFFALLCFFIIQQLF